MNDEFFIVLNKNSVHLKKKKTKKKHFCNHHTVICLI